MTATVMHVPVAVGDAVAAGNTLAIVDVMKMEHTIISEVDGVVSDIDIEPGQVVEVGDQLIVIDTSTKVSVPVNAVRTSDETLGSTSGTNPLFEQLKQVDALRTDAARPDAVAKRRSRGQQTARENISQLCDVDSFLEYGGLAVAAQRGQRDLDDLRSKTSADGIITGVGKVDGVAVAMLAVDATVIAGTQGYWHHHKIDRLLEIAKRDDLPVVFFPEGGGGRPYDPDAGNIMTAGLQITSFARLAALSGQVPVVAVVSGRCFAGSAAFAGVADVIIATENANLGMAGPAMIEGGGLGTFTPEQIGPMDVQARNGVVDLIVADDFEAVAAAKQYLGYFTGTIVAGEIDNQELLRDVLPHNRRQTYAMVPIIEALSDGSSWFELRPDFGPAIHTGLAQIGGRTVGIAASNPQHQAGAIGPDEADKAARFFQLCDAHGVPLVSLCDCPGFMVGPDVEERANVRHVSRLFLAGAHLTVPIVGVIVRKAYGLGAMAMLGGNLHVPVATVAWPTGEIGGMGFEGAVALGMKNELAAIDDESDRRQAFDTAVARMYERGSALTSAAHLEFDAVIDPAATRTWIMQSLSAAEPIARGARYIDAW